MKHRVNVYKLNFKSCCDFRALSIVYNAVRTCSFFARKVEINNVFMTER